MLLGFLYKIKNGDIEEKVLYIKRVNEKELEFEELDTTDNNHY